MRLKIVAGNLAVVLLLSLIAFFTVRYGIRSEMSREIDSSIVNDQLLADRSFRLAALNFLADVSERAADRQVSDVFDGLDDNSRRTRAYEAAEATSAWLGDPARGRRASPDIVVITDETGRALARNGARNVMFGKLLVPSLPALSDVLKYGKTRHDVWLEENEKKLLRTAMAPIRDDKTGNIIGALVAGYDLSDGVAKEQGGILGCDLAFITKEKVYSSSLEGNAAKALATSLLGARKVNTEAVLSGSASRTEPWNASLSGDEYIGITARLPMSDSLPVAYAVLGDRTAKMALASYTNVILYLLVIGAFLVVVYGFVIGNSIERQIERVEEGVLAVINGRTELRLETDSPELGGLAYRINQLLNVFTGTEETSEDADGRMATGSKDDAWKDAAFTDGVRNDAVGSAATQAAADSSANEEVIDDPAVAAQLAAEEEGAYYTRVFNEYVGAKQKLGENVSNIAAERFSQRLKGRAEALAKQYGCRSVRFQVQTGDNQVALRPVLIR